MKVYGRKLLDKHGEKHEIDFDDLVFECDDGKRITVSVYRAKTNGRVEIRGLDGALVILPSASNTIDVETRR